MILCLTLLCKQIRSPGADLIFFLRFTEDFYLYFFLICKTLDEFYLVFTSDYAFHPENEELQILASVQLTSDHIKTLHYLLEALKTLPS